MKRFLFMTLVVIVFCPEGLAQSTTNVGTEFWIAFPPNGSITAVKQLYISSVFSTSGMIESDYPGVNQNFSVTPGIVTQITLPTGIALQGGIENKGIYITTDDPVSVYGLNNQTASTDAFLALPVNALGLDYRILSYATTINGNGSSFSVVAIQDGTALTVFNHQTNTTTNVNLDAGQTYHVEAGNLNEDLTGSRIQSNFPVSVFGSVKVGQVPPGCTFADHIVEQMFPYYSWGKNFVTVPLAGRNLTGDVFRILAAVDGTEIEVNGTLVATINEGDYYDTTLQGTIRSGLQKPRWSDNSPRGRTAPAERLVTRS